MIGHFDQPGDPVKLAQGVKSKAFHFTSRICSQCNNVVTQPADREFDRLLVASKTLLEKGENPKLVFSEPRYIEGSDAYLNVFRYFAKLLCCHLAASEAPRPIHMSRFARGETNENCIWLNLDEDWFYKQLSSQLGISQYAAHGGLVVYGDKESGGANAFHSTLTVGRLRYIFFSRLNAFERLELRLCHPKFYNWCQTRVREAVDQPLSERDQLKLGLVTEELPRIRSD